MQLPSRQTAVVSLLLYLSYYVVAPLVSAAALPNSMEDSVTLQQSTDPYTGYIFKLKWSKSYKELEFSLLDNETPISSVSYPLLFEIDDISASAVYSADLVVIAALTKNGSIHLEAMNSQGQKFWSKQFKGKVTDLAFGEKGEQVLLTGQAVNGQSLLQIINIHDGEILDNQVGETYLKRKLMSTGEDTLIPKEEERAFMAVEWLLALVGIIEITLIIGGIITACYGANKYFKDKKEEKEARIAKAKRQEEQRRVDERKQLTNFKTFNFAKELFGVGKPALSLGLTSAEWMLDGSFKFDESNKAGALSASAKPAKQERFDKELIRNGMLYNYLSRQEVLEEIFTAARNGDLKEILRLLGIYKEYVDETDESGNTVLHFIAATTEMIPSSELNETKEETKQRLQDIVKFLIKLGANPESQNMQGMSPIILAAQQGNSIVFEQLIMCHPPLSFRTRSLLFHMLAQDRLINSTERFRLLVQERMHYGINFRNICHDQDWLTCIGTNSVSEGGLTILHEAAISGNYEILELILKEKMVDADEVDLHGNTASYYAALHDREGGRSIEILQEHHADTQRVNELGRSPLDNAKFRDDEELIELLQTTP